MKEYIWGVKETCVCLCRKQPGREGRETIKDRWPCAEVLSWKSVEPPETWGPCDAPRGWEEVWSRGWASGKENRGLSGQRVGSSGINNFSMWHFEINETKDYFVLTFSYVILGFLTINFIMHVRLNQDMSYKVAGNLWVNWVKEIKVLGFLLTGHWHASPVLRKMKFVM